MEGEKFLLWSLTFVARLALLRFLKGMGETYLHFALDLERSGIVRMRLQVGELKEYWETGSAGGRVFSS